MTFGHSTVVSVYFKYKKPPVILGGLNEFVRALGEFTHRAPKRGRGDEILLLDLAGDLTLGEETDVGPMHQGVEQSVRLNPEEVRRPDDGLLHLTASLRDPSLGVGGFAAGPQPFALLFDMPPVL